MRRLTYISLLLLLTLGWAGQSWAAFGETWTDSGSTSVWASSTIGTVAVSAVSGDTICAISTVASSSRTMTITDNKSGGTNTYSRLATHEVATEQEVWIDCTVSTGTVTQITGTISSTAAGRSHLTAVVVTGARATLGTASIANNTSGTSHAPGSLSTTDATGLFILLSHHVGTQGITLDGAYASRYTDTGYVIGSAEITTSSTPTNTTAGTRGCINILAEIRPAAGGGGGGAAPRGLLLGVW